MYAVYFNTSHEAGIFRAWIKDNLGVRTECYNVPDEEDTE